jgi:hypothetical protein
MAKVLRNIYPGLRAKMSYNDENAETVAKLLNISVDSARRRLRGQNYFDIPQIRTLIAHYGSTFDELFGKQDETEA